MAKIVAQYTYTDAEELAIVKEAIIQVQAGAQTYTIAGRSYTAPPLSVLYDRERYLEQKIAASQGLAYNLIRFSHR